MAHATEVLAIALHGAAGAAWSPDECIWHELRVLLSPVAAWRHRPRICNRDTRDIHMRLALFSSREWSTALLKAAHGKPRVAKEQFTATLPASAVDVDTFPQQITTGARAAGSN